MRAFVFAMIMLFGLGSYCLAQTAELTDKDVRSAIQNKQFGEAVKMIDSMLPKYKGDVDYMLYLKALSLYYNKDYADAIKPCDEIIVEHEKSVWSKKAVFLKAECYIQQKKFDEAEKIYSQEVQRLLSSERKEDIAGVYFRFAEALSYKPSKDELDVPQPNYAKAYEIYKKVLELEIGDSMKDETMFRLGRMMQLSNNFGQAVNDYHQYLDDFDPDWMGAVDSPQKSKESRSKIPQGKHRFEVRYYLAESQLAMGQYLWARTNLENLLNLMPKSDENDKVIRDSRLLLVRTYHIPHPIGYFEMENGIKLAHKFIADFPNDARFIQLAYDIAETYENQGRTDDAVNAYKDFTNMGYHDGVMKEEESMKVDDFRQLLMSAYYKIGQMELGRKNYSDAIEIWNKYISLFPDGPNWADAQQGITNTEYQIGFDLLAQNRYDEAIASWNKFIEKYPFDYRSTPILFAFGQIKYYLAEQAEKNKQENDAKTKYQEAITEWSKLVSKYPNIEQSSLALFRIGQIYEEKLFDFDKALESYRKLTWGSWYGQAQQRIREMTEKKLELATERIFRTNEPAKIKLTIRNVEKLTVDIYKLDLEAYWRKTHGIMGVENLDIALISPDNTQEYPIPEYRKYKLFEQYIEIPMEGAGVYAVHIGEDDLEATTLVIRSDIDVIVKTSRREVLVFAEDMLKSEPAPNARVLISDGTKVIGEGETDKDGIFKKKLDELKDTGNVTAFVVKDGSVASNSLNIAELGLSVGLTPRGYIYTDRPAYRPGQKVSIKAIIRDVKDGVYSISESEYEVSITDSNGRLLRSETLKPSKFGTLNMDMMLDENASLGEYQITAQSKDDESKVFSGNFLVQVYQLEKMKLAIEFPRKVYFRGEKVEATFIASYYYGQPVTNRMIRYTLPDGTTFTEQVNDEGKLKVEFDTTATQPGSVLAFGGTIEGENLPWVSDSVFVAQLGFSIAVQPSIDVAISGEPFDVNIETKGADGKPVGKELTLTVYRQIERPQHPILSLSQIPWMENVAGGTISEVKGEEYKVTTDDKTGNGVVKITLTDGGRYVLRATGTDRFDQPVSGKGFITISDDKDSVKLRIVADTSELKVGETVTIKIHSRLEQSALALLTFEGEGIINHKVQKLNKGWNDVALNVTNDYFPNFRVAVSAMSVENEGTAPNLVTADKNFTVKRQLVIAIKPSEYYKPGEDGEIEITVTDQVGKPIETELSLALVEEALYAIYPDGLTPITDFFNEGIQRDARMMTASSCAFSYHPTTHKVIKELLEEAKRLEVAKEWEREKAGAQVEVADELASMVTNGAVRKYIAAPAATKQVMGREMRTQSSLKKADMKDKEFYAAYDASAMVEEGKAGFGVGGRAGGSGLAETQVREELADAGYWIPVVVTDANGKAKVTIPMPEKITQWRITSRGCSVETVVGQATANTITRKDFFVEVKLPPIVTEGDTIRTLVRVHNLTDYEGDVSVSLKVDIDGKDTSDQKQVSIKKNSTTEVVFKGMLISAGREAKFEVTAKAGEMTDGIKRTIPIRPWGIEYADSKGGVSSGSETIFLQLPDQIFNSKQLTVSVGPSVNRLIFDLAMNSISPREMSFANKIIPVPGDTGSDLLAVVYAINYLKKIGGNPNDSKQLMDRARNLVSNLVINQRDDGGWGWIIIKDSGQSDINISARTFWALAEAKKQGIIVNPQMMEKATAYLKTAFTRVDQNDDDIKSVILHALSNVGEADFAYANRLYRNRNDMNPSALAYTALTFVNLERNEVGGEMLDVLVGKKIESLDIETVSLGLLAMESIRPSSPTVKQYVDYLLSKRSYIGYSPYRAKGPITASLATYYGQTQFAKSDYRLQIIVNGDKIKELEVRSEQPSIIIPIPTKSVKDGQNKVEFRMEGNGNYAYTATLSGFSPEIKDPNSWDRPNIQSRKYYHAPLEYKGKQVSYSSTEITQLPDGARTNVSVSIRDSATSRYIIITEYLPSGTMLVDGSVSGGHQYYEVGDGMITFYFMPGRSVRDFSYQLVSYAPGTYKILPTVIKDAMKPGEMRIGEMATLEVLAPGEKSKDVYKMNDAELYEFGRIYFEESNYKDSLSMLSKLYEGNKNYNQREVARMLLWIYTEDEYYNAHRVIEFFEILRERFPELYIPFDKILVVGKAYRDIGEFERAYLVYKATIDASFINDSNVSAVLQDEGQFFNSIDFQENLWREYPDIPQVVSSYFALSQALYSKVPQVDQLAKTERKMKLLKEQSDRDITKLELLKETIMMLSQFLTLYPNDPLADDAVFSMANALLDLEDYKTVVLICQTAQKRYPQSDYIPSFQYVEALGFFWQRMYDKAVNAAKLVAEGKSKDKNLSEYIVGQIYHAQGKPQTAMEWYKKVEEIYPDAKESISYFEEKRISMDEVKIFRPNEDVKIKIKYRNIKEAFLQVYRVDLMKLYLREKDLNKISQVHLAGIKPEQNATITLGDGKDYIDKEKDIDLSALKEDKTYKDGAYLIICRGDDLFTSGLVLVTPLDVEIQEDTVSGRVRVNVRDVVKNEYREGVHAKAIGSAQTEFKSGKTDLRGLFIADDINGVATVIARENKDTYAFYRGKQWLGTPEGVQVEQQVEMKYPQDRPQSADYRSNIDVMNQAIQADNIKEFDQIRRGVQKGVQVQKAY